MTRSEDDLRFGFLPWEFRHQATEEQLAEQKERQNGLASAGDMSFGDEVYVDSSAAVFCSRLDLGDRAYIGAHAYVTGDVEAGPDSTINPFAVVRGEIRLGAGVRIGAHSSLLAFNHGFAADRPVFRQPVTSKGIVVGDDVWIGSNVTVLDGVSIGSHAVIGAGAVVTKDVPEWAIVAGNPARVLRDRRDERPTTKLPRAPGRPGRPGSTVQTAPTAAVDADRLAAFADRARDQAADLVARCYDGRALPRSSRSGRTSAPGVTPSRWLRSAPAATHRPSTPAATWCERLRAWQDPETGLTPDGDLADAGLAAGRPETSSLSAFEGSATYHILCVGYALQLLGSSFAYPIRAVDALEAHTLEHRLDALPWSTHAWSAGNTIDGLGTACARNMHDFGADLDDAGRGPLMTLVGWLAARVDPEHGMWVPARSRRRLAPGGQRLLPADPRNLCAVRDGASAPGGGSADHPRATRVTGDSSPATHYTACNVLDVVHPLWLAAKETDARSSRRQAMGHRPPRPHPRPLGRRGGLRRSRRSAPGHASVPACRARRCGCRRSGCSPTTSASPMRSGTAHAACTDRSRLLRLPTLTRIVRRTPPASSGDRAAWPVRRIRRSPARPPPGRPTWHPRRTCPARVPCRP